MGKGGHNPFLTINGAQDINSSSESTIPHQLPTLSEIKVKIPAHCFRPTIRQSMSYVIKDVIYVALTYVVMQLIQSTFQFGFLLFPIYWYIQGQYKIERGN
jgi:fatty acid desaturase